MLKDDPRKPWKAVAAGLIAFLGLLWANLDGRDVNTITGQEWVSIIIGTLVTFGGTFLVPNPKTAGKHAARNQLGYGALEVAIAAVVLVILILVLLRLA